MTALVPGETTFLYVNDEPIGTCVVNADGSVALPMKPKPGGRVMWLQPSEWEWQEWESQFDDDAWRCDLCDGDGLREYNDAPDEWGEDCPSEVNHLIECRGCGEVERAKHRAFAAWLLEKHTVTPPNHSPGSSCNSGPECP